MPVLTSPPVPEIVLATVRSEELPKVRVLPFSTIVDPAAPERLPRVSESLTVRVVPVFRLTDEESESAAPPLTVKPPSLTTIFAWQPESVSVPGPDLE